MSDDRMILHGERGPGGLCADDLGVFVMLTVDEAGRSEQVDLSPEQCRQFGEWLIRKADAAIRSPSRSIYAGGVQ